MPWSALYLCDCEMYNRSLWCSCWRYRVWHLAVASAGARRERKRALWVGIRRRQTWPGQIADVLYERTVPAHYHRERPHTTNLASPERQGRSLLRAGWHAALYDCADDGQTVITVLTVRQLHAKLPIKDVGGPAARSGPGQREHWACAGAGAAEDMYLQADSNAYAAVPDGMSPKAPAGDMSTGAGVALAVMVGCRRPLRAQTLAILECATMHSRRLMRNLLGGLSISLSERQFGHACGSTL